jgi:hypothetical protein
MGSFARISMTFTGPRSVAMESHRAKVYHLGRLSQGCITGGFERLFG